MSPCLSVLREACEARPVSAAFCAAEGAGRNPPDGRPMAGAVTAQGRASMAKRARAPVIAEPVA